MRLPTWITPTRLLLAGIVLAAASLRLASLADLPPGLYPDEATEGNDALAALEGRWDWFYPGNNGREGLYANLQSIALAVAGVREPWVLRLVSALAGILTVPGMYLLGRELWGRRAGLIAAALLAGSFWHVVFSRVGFRAILAPLVLVFALWALLAGVRRVREGANGWPLAALGGFLAGVGLHTYIAFRAAGLAFAAIGIALIACARDARRRVAAALALAGVCAAIAAAPLAHYFATHPGSFGERADQVAAWETERPAREIARNVALMAGMLAWNGDRNWRHNDSGAPAVALPVLACTLVGAALLWRRKHDAAIVGALLVAGALPAVLSNEGMPHALRGILLVVPVMLLSAFALDRAARRWPRAGIALAVLVCGGALASTAVRYPAYAAKPEVRDEFTTSYLEAGRALLQRDRARDAYVIVPDGDVRIGGMPVAAQTVMFVTGTATREAQQRERVFYATSTDGVPPDAQVYDLR